MQADQSSGTLVMIRPALLLLSLATCAAGQNTVPAPAAKFPGLNVQVTVGTQQRPQRNSSYMKTMTISPKITIDGTSRLTPIPEMEATMLIITMDTRAKYTAKDEVFNVLTAETIKIPAAASGERRSLAFTESTVSFDSYRDNSNIGGAVYKYYVFVLRDPATKALLDFKSNYLALMTYVKTNPEKREEFLGLKKGSKLPTDFK
jgi:hypothetical protein